MKYIFTNNILKLVRYRCGAVNESGDSITYNAVNAEEKNGFLEVFPEAVVEEIDNSGYEWLDGMAFTNEQKHSGEVDKAIKLGETEYAKYVYANDRDAQMLELDYRLSLIELGLGGESL